ncbi:2-oxoacid:acceptor oxidoreductase subunit alpha [Candidatus Saccharibacteria bacterium]|jgi:2-oxoglutarate ferredoxin oxidoreductase subunit alpha|nr:2-oxoacid:acceptor oxidoreductase subunit alpha [Candidatus Saccharibacteria bacterium]
MRNDRLRIKFAGESGQGIDSVGKAITEALVWAGYYTFGYREYPSLIKGAWANYQVDVSDRPLQASSEKCDVLLCISRYSIYEYLPTLVDGGQLIHSMERLELPDNLQDFVADHNITIEYVKAIEIAEAEGGSALMENVVLVGVLWQLLGIPLESFQNKLKKLFAKKPELLKLDLKCAEAGYNYKTQHAKKIDFTNTFKSNKKLIENQVIDGNYAISKGTVDAGVRAFYAYPMTPSSSVLTYLADWQFETKMVVKQIEDEISAAQFTIGSSFMGTRAMTATSGGGFDLMTESISLAGITETPFVIFLAQRPGPGTGLPTWTMAADLPIAVYGGHGEFARIVVAASDPKTAYRVTQEAHNLAEMYRVPVIILSEKQIAESLYNIDSLGEKVAIKRQLTNKPITPESASDFYNEHKSGVSPRWFPGDNLPVYLSNSDEHDGEGNSVEDGPTTKLQYGKRIAKQKLIEDALPLPKIYGNKDSKNYIIGWGSTANTVLDLIENYDNLAYVHFEYLWPLKAEEIARLFKNKTLFSVENNYTSQLATLLQSQLPLNFAKQFTKYDGRGFFVEDMETILEEVNQS